MYLLEFPKEIDELIEKYRPYFDKIQDGKLNEIPKEAADAYKKVLEWSIEQGQ